MLTTTDEASAYGCDVNRSERLRLRAATDEDLALLVEAWDDPGLTILQDGTVRTRSAAARVEEQRSWYANTAATPDLGVVIERIEDGEVIGGATVWRMSVAVPVGTLSINLRPAHLGQGYGTEAVRLVVDHAFRSVPLHRIGLGVYAYNDRALRCYEAVGFREEGRRREVVFADGAWHDLVVMGLLRSEWEAARSGRREAD